jgi:O-antigen/teichoic acid export membrane protein
MSFVRNVAAVLLITAVAIPLSLATNVVLARYLSVSDRGTYALLVTFSAIASVVAQLGWPEAVIYRVKRHGVPIDRAFATGLAAHVALLLLLVALAELVRPWLAPLVLPGVDVGLYRLAVLGAWLLVVGEYLRGTARSLDRFDVQNWFGVLQSTGLLAALALVLVGYSGGVYAALAATVGLWSALVLIFLPIVARMAGLSRRVDWDEAREHLRYGIAIYPQGLLNHLHERLDVFVLAALGISAAEIGIYAVAVGLIGPLRLLPGAIGVVLLPKLASSTDSAAAEFTAAVARQSALQMAAISLAMVPIGTVMLPLLFGEAYRAAIVPFLVLLPAITALSVSRVLARYFATVNRQRALLGVRSVALGSNVVLCLLLIPPLAIPGAALASLVSYVLEAALVTYLFLSDSGLDARTALLLRRTDLDPYVLRARRLAERLGL